VLRHAQAPEFDSRTWTTSTMTGIDYDSKIPNNVDLVGRRSLQRAL
jgi:hypothetical protein